MDAGVLDHWAKHGWTSLLPETPMMTPKEEQQIVDDFPTGYPLNKYYDVLETGDTGTLPNVRGWLADHLQAYVEAIVSEFPTEDQARLEMRFSNLTVINYGGPGPQEIGHWHMDEGQKPLLVAIVAPIGHPATQVFEFDEPQALEAELARFKGEREKTQEVLSGLVFQPGPYRSADFEIPEGQMGLVRRFSPGRRRRTDPIVVSAPVERLFAMLPGTIVRPPEGSIVLLSTPRGSFCLNTPSAVHRVPPFERAYRLAIYQNVLELEPERSAG
jgi:hypothetical protein